MGFWIFRKNRYSQRRGKVTILSGDSMLNHIATDLLAGLDPADLPDTQVTIYLGVHLPFGRRYDRKGLRIGIQTEQFNDEAGQPLWGRRHGINLGHTLESLNHLDLLLDVNFPNRAAYGDVAEAHRHKLRFGPHIFPSRAPPYSPPATDKLAFFGAMGGDRRRPLVERHVASGYCDAFDTTTFGTRLMRRLVPYRGVLNLHFAEGVYTEYPRLLTTLNAGKPLVSERLTGDLVPGRHYVLLGQDSPEIDMKAIYESCAGHLTGHYSFADFLRRSIADCAA